MVVKSTKLLVRVMVLILLLSGMNLYASETRVASMGGIGLYTRDNTNVMFFPGTIMYYQNQMRAELRSPGTEAVWSTSVYLPVLTNHVLGVEINYQISAFAPVVGDFFPGSKVKLTQGHAFMYGMRLGNMNVGGGIVIGFDGNKTEGTTDLEESASYFGLSAGASTKLWDVGLALQLPSIESKYGELKDSWSGFGFRLAGRAFIPLNKKMELVPLGLLGMQSSSQDFSGGGADGTIDYSRLMAGIGGAINYQASDSTLIILAVEAFGYEQTSEKVKDGDETTDATMTLPGIYIGAESQVCSWLALRLGAAHVSQSILGITKPNQGDQIEEFSMQSGFNISFGLGIRIGSFLLDLDINEQQFFNGPHFINGRVANSGLVNYLSMSYEL